MNKDNPNSILSQYRHILTLPIIFDIFANFIVGGRRELVKTYIHPRAGDKILDIGCGTGALLGYLPKEIDYYGFDISSEYIDLARKKFRSHPGAHFECIDVNEYWGLELASLDIVIANGVLHHLRDDKSEELISLAKAALKPTGRFIALDGCYEPGQSRLARYFISKDRGRYVRNSDDYIRLAEKVFKKVNGNIRHDLLHIPYTLIVMECSHGH